MARKLLSLSIWRLCAAAIRFASSLRRERPIQLCERTLFSRSTMVFTPLTTIVFVLLPLYCWCATPTVVTSLVAANIDGLKSQFQTAMKSFSDVESLHYTLAGIKELGVQPPESYCNDIKRLVDKSSVESIYHATEAAKAINNCKVDLEESIEMCFFSYTTHLVIRRRVSIYHHSRSTIREEHHS